MKLEVTIQLLRFCFHVLNSVFLVLGLSIAGCAVWILFDKGSFLAVLSSVELQTVGVGLLVIGGVVVVVSVVGCVGAATENRFLLLTYLGFLLVLVLGQFFITLLLLLNRDKIEESLDQTVDDIILQYGRTSSHQDRLMDNIQHHAGCCGRTGPADWLHNSFIQSLNLTRPDVLPCSCFSFYRRSSNSSWCSELLNFTAPLYGLGNGSFEQGCKTKLGDWLQENAVTILSMDFGLMLIQVIQFVFIVYLYRAFGRKAAMKTPAPLADSDHAPLDHAPLDHAPEEDLHYAQLNEGYID